MTKRLSRIGTLVILVILLSAREVHSQNTNVYTVTLEASPGTHTVVMYLEGASIEQLTGYTLYACIEVTEGVQCSMPFVPSLPPTFLVWFDTTACGVTFVYRIDGGGEVRDEIQHCVYLPMIPEQEK